ncbi:DUF2092 domain-containing protein [Dechloromonas denitrificans]|uniref:DUF2092 domain-containing protein n=1 Tax=Dechloromonas denitrificans TaxID=281362 RepID=UPI0009FB0E68|nr:DUF2092 domain-containing protein [Dechloromonas denitrificans]
MKLKKLTPVLVALALGAPGLHAQTSPSRSNAVDPASIQALKDMGAYLRSMQRYSVSTELTGERVLADGQKLQHTAAAELEVASPNQLRARMYSARSQREIYYDGKMATLYTPQQKYYSSVEFDGPLSVLVTKLEERYGVEIPLYDLFTWGTPAAALDKIESGMNAGQDFIGPDLCNHYAFRQGNVDWQIWISVGNKPLPRKLVITNRGDEARPQSVTLMDWKLKPGFKDAVFKFTPPKGSTAVELRPLDKSKGGAS